MRPPERPARQGARGWGRAAWGGAAQGRVTGAQPDEAPLHARTVNAQRYAFCVAWVLLVSGIETAAVAGQGVSDMDTAARFAPTIGRLLLGAFFLLAGFDKLTGDIAGLASFIETGGLPGFLAWPTIIFEIAVGAALILGWQTRIAALAGAAFCLVTAVLYHFDPADQMQMISFMKNIAITGGFLALFGSGPGALALGRS